MGDVVERYGRAMVYTDIDSLHVTLSEREIAT